MENIVPTRFFWKDGINFKRDIITSDSIFGLQIYSNVTHVEIQSEMNDSRLHFRLPKTIAASESFLTDNRYHTWRVSP